MIINLFTAAAVPAAWLSMVYRGGGTLSSRGFWSLKYFTVLSNLFCGCSALLWLFLRKNRSHNELTSFLKFSSSMAVFITFLVVLFFLGPLFGFHAMYAASNLWFHLIIPLTAVTEFIFFPEYEPGKKEIMLSVIPLLLYGTAYMLNILINGIERNDWYGFGLWGIPAGILMFLILCLIHLLLALLLSRLSRMLRIS